MPLAAMKLYGAAALLCASVFFLNGTPATHASEPGTALATPQGWVPQQIGHSISFAYPADFVPVNDGGPYVTEVGGALLNKARTQYELLLGVEIDSQPHLTVESAANQFLHNYRNDTLVADRQTAYGRELQFAMPAHMSYTIYLAPCTDGVREIVINNEHSSTAYTRTIQTFLQTVKQR
ncbi:MAG: hypothetical protein OWT28_09455 [Firmicutes bacterium]|nr:hypothetical protein [Bacillota bacterium]